MSARTEIETLSRRLLDEKLAQCTEEDRAFFQRIFPRGVPASSLEPATDLCNRTIAANALTNTPRCIPPGSPQ